MRRKVLLSIVVALLLPVLVLSGRALADLSAEEMPLDSAGCPKGTHQPRAHPGH